MNTAFAAALLDPALPCPAHLRAWNGSDATRRFSVHRNNVVGSLVDDTRRGSYARDRVRNVPHRHLLTPLPVRTACPCQRLS